MELHRHSLSPAIGSSDVHSIHRLNDSSPNIKKTYVEKNEGTIDTATAQVQTLYTQQWIQAKIKGQFCHGKFEY